MEEGSILKIENLSHRYSVKWAIKDINIDIREKGIYGLLGSNGAGKSTLMNIVCGAIKQTSGFVSICGIDTISAAVPSKHKIGFLPQKPPLHTELTVREYLTHCAKLRDMSSKEAKNAVEVVLKICSLEAMKNRLISNLSGGYQQRVGVAQAILHKPEIVIFDEPTNGLDPNQILDIRTLIRNIAKDRTVILSTHMLSEVQAICDKIIMIENGGVIFNGSLTDFDNYITPDTVLMSLLNPPALSCIESVENVISVTFIGGTEYRVKCSNVDSVIQNLIASSYEKGWKMDAINKEKCSMNTVFAHLSRAITQEDGVEKSSL